MVLRMNRRFMEFTRTIYPDLAKALAKQHFGCTVVEEAEVEVSVLGLRCELLECRLHIIVIVREQALFANCSFMFVREVWLYQHVFVNRLCSRTVCSRENLANGNPWYKHISYLCF